MKVVIKKAFGKESKPSQYTNEDGTPKEWISNNFLADYDGVSIRVNTNFKEDLTSLVGRKVELINALQDKTLPTGVVQYKMTYKDKATIRVLEDNTVPNPAVKEVNPQPQNKEVNVIALIKEQYELRERIEQIESILKEATRK